MFVAALVPVNAAFASAEKKRARSRRGAAEGENRAARVSVRPGQLLAGITVA